MIINAIAAVDINMAIGKNNQLPWRAAADMAFFKKTTLNNSVLMGFNTYLSLPKSLPSRNNIVLTSKNIAQLHSDGFYFVNNIEQAINICQQLHSNQLFIIGGAQIYTQFLAYCNYLYLSHIYTSVEMADVYFPDIPKEWQLIQKEHKKAAENTTFDIDFCLYQNNNIKVLLY